MKTAIVIGATGLVGKALTCQLLDSVSYNRVVVLVRKSMEINHPKFTEHLVDFDQPELWKHLLSGDVLFSCMGTTLAKAGSKEAQFKIDYEYQYAAAKTASENGIPTYVLISSTGANEQSNNFYLRMKGTLDKAVLKLPFKAIHILRPGQLDGNRNEYRRMERFSLLMMHSLNKIGLFQKYRPIRDYQLASAMINIANEMESKILNLNQIFDFV